MIIIIQLIIVNHDFKSNTLHHTVDKNIYGARVPGSVPVLTCAMHRNLHDNVI